MDILKELFGTSDEIQISKSLFGNDTSSTPVELGLDHPLPSPSRDYLSNRPLPLLPVEPRPQPTTSTSSLIRSHSLDDLHCSSAANPLTTIRSDPLRAQSVFPQLSVAGTANHVNLHNVPHEMPAVLLEDDEGNDEELMRLLETTTDSTPDHSGRASVASGGASSSSGMSFVENGWGDGVSAALVAMDTTALEMVATEMVTIETEEVAKEIIEAVTIAESMGMFGGMGMEVSERAPSQCSSTSEAAVSSPLTGTSSSLSCSRPTHSEQEQTSGLSPSPALSPSSPSSDCPSFTLTTHLPPSSPLSSSTVTTHLPPSSPPSSSTVTTHLSPSSPPSSSTVTTHLPPSSPPSSSTLTTHLPPSSPPSSSTVTTHLPPSSFTLTTHLPPSSPPSSSTVTTHLSPSSPTSEESFTNTTTDKHSQISVTDSICSASKLITMPTNTVATALALSAVYNGRRHSMSPPRLPHPSSPLRSSLSLSPGHHPPSLSLDLYSTRRPRTRPVRTPTPLTSTPLPLPYSAGTPLPLPHSAVTPLPHTPVTPLPLPHSAVTPLPLPHSAVTPLPLPHTAVTPLPLPHTAVTPLPLPHTAVTPLPLPHTAVTPLPLPHTAVTPLPLPHTAVTPLPLPHTAATHTAVTPLPLPHTAVTPLPLPHTAVTHTAVTPLPLPHTQVTPLPLPHTAGTPLPLPHTAVTPLPLPRSAVTPLPLLHTPVKSLPILAPPHPGNELLHSTPTTTSSRDPLTPVSPLPTPIPTPAILTSVFQAPPITPPLPLSAATSMQRCIERLRQQVMLQGKRLEAALKSFVPNTGSGHSSSGQGAAGQSSSGQGVAGKSNSGQGAAGQSSSGQGAAGLSSSGQGAAGLSSSGQGAAGLSSSGQGATGQSSSVTGQGSRPDLISTPDTNCPSISPARFPQPINVPSLSHIHTATSQLCDNLHGNHRAEPARGTASGCDNTTVGNCNALANVTNCDDTRTTLVPVAIVSTSSIATQAGNGIQLSPCLVAMETMSSIRREECPVNQCDSVNSETSKPDDVINKQDDVMCRAADSEEALTDNSTAPLVVIGNENSHAQRDDNSNEPDVIKTPKHDIITESSPDTDVGCTGEGGSDGGDMVCGESGAHGDDCGGDKTATVVEGECGDGGGCIAMTMGGACASSGVSKSVTETMATSECTSRSHVPKLVSSMSPFRSTFSVCVPAMNWRVQSFGSVCGMKALPITILPHVTPSPNSLPAHEGETAVLTDKHKKNKRRRNGGGWPKGKRRKIVTNILPKPPSTPYVLYLSDQKQVMVNGSVKSMPQLSKTIGKMWSDLPSHVKQEYEEKAVRDRRRFLDELKTHFTNKQKKNGCCNLEAVDSLLNQLVMAAEDDSLLHCPLCQISFRSLYNKQSHYCSRIHTDTVFSELDRIGGARNESCLSPCSVHGMGCETEQRMESCDFEQTDMECGTVAGRDQCCNDNPAQLPVIDSQVMSGEGDDQVVEESGDDQGVEESGDGCVTSASCDVCDGDAPCDDSTAPIYCSTVQTDDCDSRESNDVIIEGNSHARGDGWVDTSLMEWSQCYAGALEKLKQQTSLHCPIPHNTHPQSASKTGLTSFLNELREQEQGLIKHIDTLLELLQSLTSSSK